MERERGNPTYAFLFELQSALHQYYRWRVFSFAQGDTLTRWRVDPFVMVQGGPRWLPPPLPEDSADKKQEAPTAAAGKGRVSHHLGEGVGARAGGTLKWSEQGSDGVAYEVCALTPRP